MSIRKYNVTLTGITPLLMHQDNISFCERVKKWQKDPLNKQLSVKGDDRSPAWTWIGYCYQDRGSLYMPTANIMSCLRDGGKKCPAAIGKGSMKAQTQAGISVAGNGFKLLVNGGVIPTDGITALENIEEFSVHEKVVADMGFELDVRRAVVGTAKHVRVRPIFHNWVCVGQLIVGDSTITTEVLQTILNQSGYYCGLGDWRPASPSPGSYGRFEAVVEES